MLEEKEQTNKKNVFDKDPEYQNLNNERTELYLGDLACLDDDFLEEPNDDSLTELDLNVTAGYICQKSREYYGVTEPLVIIKMFYLTKPSTADIFDTSLLYTLFNPRYHS